MSEYNMIDGYDDPFLTGEPIEQRNVTPYGVYISIDPEGRIYAVNSDAFLLNLTGWIKIDEGYGDKYHHAQGNYFNKPLVDMRGIFQCMAAPVAEWQEREAVVVFTYEDGEEWGVYERTQEEMDADYTPPEPKPETDNNALVEQVAALQKQVDEQAAMLVSYEAAYQEGVQSV